MIGGAVGDALGFPVEFYSEDRIFQQFGTEGISRLSSCIDPEAETHLAFVSDDTQMLLFAANALVWHRFNGGTLHDALWLGYREWLGTQGDRSLMDDPSEPKMWLFGIPELHKSRAPGNTCLSAIHNSNGKGTPCSAVNNSKGCGTVMRAAPFGLAWRENKEKSVQETRKQIISAAIEDAALTHGHPFAHLSSAALALMVYEAVNHRNSYDSLEKLALFVISHIKSDRFADFASLLERAVLQAGDSAVTDLDGIHALGEGWVAEEALAIALFCAVRYQDDFAAALHAAVNHKGDSDSTGAICGNLLGAWLGKKAIDSAMDTENLELSDTLLTMADDLITCASGVDLSKYDMALYDRYHYGGRPVWPQYILDVTINNNPVDNLSADALIMPAPGHFCTETETMADPHSPPWMLGSKHIRSETALSPHGRIRMVQVDVPVFSPERRELLTSCYCAALRESVCYHKEVKDNPPKTIALPLLGVKNEGWPAEVSSSCMLEAIHSFYEEWHFHERMAKKIYLCAEGQYHSELQALLKNRSLAFLAQPMNCGRYDPCTWQELRRHFMDPQYSDLTYDEFFNMCMETLSRLTGVKPAMKAEGVWRTAYDSLISVNYQSWFQLMLPALLQRFCQLWPEACSDLVTRRTVSYYNQGSFEWLLPDSLPLDGENIGKT